MSEELSRTLAKKKTSILSTATFLVFEPGLYTISFNASSSGASDVGLRLPSARLEAVPSVGGGQASISTIPVGGWISTETATAHILVVGGRAGALLTIYRSSDAVDTPTVEFRAVLKAVDMAKATVLDKPAEPQLGGAGGMLQGVSVTAHIQDLGDVRGGNGEWIGQPNNRNPVEGFQLTVPAGLEAADFEYQGIMGKDWLTPWFKAGSYCGSRGLQLPMLGFRVRLLGEAAKAYSLQYWGVFGPDGTIGPFTDGELCQADDKVLTAMKVTIAAAAPLAATDPPTEEAEPAAAEPDSKPGKPNRRFLGRKPRE